MKRLLGYGLVAAAVVVGGLGAREACSSTSVSGIPGDCQMTCHRVKVDPAGKAVGEPATFADAKMIGNWTPRAFRRSWDGKTVLAYTFDGFRVTKGAESHDYKVQMVHKQFWWGPDNKKFMFWMPGGIAIANVDDLGTPGAVVKHKVVYRAPTNRFLISVAWAPDGANILVSESYEERGVTKTAIKKVPAEGGDASAILEHPDEVIVYMPADTYYEDGSGPKVKKTPILFGTKETLWVMDSDGANKTKLCDAPCFGLTDVMWDPSEKEQFLLVFRKAFTVGKKTWKGLYLVKADEAKKAAAQKKSDDYAFVEELSDATDIHSLFFSTKGKYIGWASNEAVSYRETAKAGEKPTRVALSGASGAVKGFAWDDKESKLAIAVANKLFTYDLASKASAPVASVSDRGFIAEPFWRGDEIVYASYVDASLKKKLDVPPPK
jgi:hypothetical protein